MKKKQSPKELREARRQEQSQKRAQEQEKREMKLMKKLEEQAAEEFRQKLPPKSERKSLTKAIGLKSTMIVGDSVVMTSFGKGNDAVLEKRIESRSLIDLNESKPAFRVDEITAEKYKLAQGRIKGCIATADNPMHSSASPASVPQDMLGLKPVLENRFYGQEFPEDNIHIQVIYNILDIEKILVVYATNAVYAINNLFRANTSEEEDFAGYLTTQNLYENIMNAENCTDVNQRTKENRLKTKADLERLFSNRRIGYFGQAFYESDKQQRNEMEIYDNLALIGSLRQWAVHGNKTNDPAWLYKLESLPDEFKSVLDKVYAETVRKVNYKFIKTNAVNLQILQELYPKESFASIVKEYYGFLVTKKYKNIGFSIKHLREILLDSTDYRDKEYDSVRHKLYQLLDFCIYHGYLYEDAEFAADLVNQLRASLSELDKEKIYNIEAARLADKLGSSLFSYLRRSVVGKNIQQLKKNAENLEKVKLEDIQISSGKTVSYFTKLMYLLTLFLDGKEINDLLTTLINKFDNIRVFNKTLTQLNQSTEFVEDYSFFGSSGTVFEELTVLNSFARMSRIDPSARKDMYRDAIEILGISMEMSHEKFEEMLDRILCYDEEGNPIINPDGTKKSGMRNFIATNIISSNRFKYLVRYGNATKIRALANCENAVKFVLSTIPDEQIVRYFDSCREPTDHIENNIERKREYLASIIKEMSFERFRDAEKLQRYHVDRPTNGSSVEGEQKQRYQAVIRLYLTVMYLLLKNLVYINSRYVMGFHALERDAVLYGVSLRKSRKEKSNDYSKLLVSLMDIRLPNGTIMDECDVSKATTVKNRYLHNKKWYSLAFTNYKNSDSDVIVNFRNSVAHLNAIRNIDEYIDGIGEINSHTGYFEIYHYIIQKRMQAVTTDKSKLQPKTEEYFENLSKYHTYCKDFVKAYCVPMAYNLPRYKNLTIDGQFDRNIHTETKE